MWLPRSLTPILGVAIVAGCTDTPLPVAADGARRPARQLAGSSTVDGFTITVIPPVAGVGEGWVLPSRILDDGTVYGSVENPSDPDVRYFRWTAGGGTVAVAEIPPVLAGVDRTVDRPGQYFYDDGRVRYRAGRECGRAGPPDPTLEDPDYCDGDFVIGTYATSSCFPREPEAGVHGAGLAVNGRCHVLAARRAYGTNPFQDLAVYLWRPEVGHRRILEDPVPDPFFQDFGVPLLNGEDQAVVLARNGAGEQVTRLWRPDLGARLLPLPAIEPGVRVHAYVTALNERGQMAGHVDWVPPEGPERTAAIVWTPPALNRASYPTVNASPVATAVRTTYLGSRKGFYTQYYKLAAPDGAGPWAVRVEWGDGTARTDTRSRAGVIDAAIHNYTRTGTYTVRVTVVDRRGRSGSDTRTITVRP